MKKLVLNELKVYVKETKSKSLQKVKNHYQKLGLAGFADSIYSKESSHPLSECTESYLDDKDFIIKCIKLDPDSFDYASNRLKQDKQILKLIPKKIIKKPVTIDKKEALRLVKKDGSELENLPIHFKKDKKVVLEAVKQYGFALMFADKSLKKDRKIVLEAVKKYGCALMDADKSLKKDKEVVLEAVKQHGSALMYANKSLKNDPDILAILNKIKK
jgi:tetratricopeptide (TPR) repeat protein